MLYGRDAELARIDQILADTREGRAGVLVIRGATGIGKSALLDEAAARADGLRLLRGVGIESEAELAFAGLHLLLRPFLDRLPNLPPVQAKALRGAFGLDEAGARDPFLVGLAVLSLLADVADDGPLLCLIDDVHWVDTASVDALLFAARRLDAEPIALIVTARDDEGALPADLAELQPSTLDNAAATSVLAECAPDLAASVRDLIVAEAHGNPLALVELAAALSPQQRAGQRPVDLGVVPLSGRVQQAFQAQIGDLPAATRAILLIAAAEHSGDLTAVLQAGPGGVADLVPAEAAGLITVTGRQVAFRHPLIRAAVYQSAPLTARLTAHRALADVLNGEDDADRRAWHAAAAVTGPNEQVAAELERSAARAGRRSGYAAAVRAYERAAELTETPPQQARRMILAGEAAATVGNLAHAGQLAQLAQNAARTDDDPSLCARISLLHAKAARAEGALHRAHAELLGGVDLIAGTDPERALWMLMEMVLLCLATGDTEAAVATADRLDLLVLPGASPLVPIWRLLRWLSYQQIGRRPAQLPPTLAAVRDIEVGSPHRQLLTIAACLAAGEDAGTLELANSIVARVRAEGMVGLLPPALTYLGAFQVFLGRHRDALATSSEAVRIGRDTGQLQWVSQASATLAWLAAVEGDEERCRTHAATAAGDGAALGASGGCWGLGLLDLGLGRPEPARRRLSMLMHGTARFQLAVVRAIPDLVEAAVRSGETRRVAEPLARLGQWAEQTGQRWIRALVLRCQAQLAPDEDAGTLYQQALDLHEADRPFEYARTALLYGEWLRRLRRRGEARPQLRAALEIFQRLDASPWVDRARGELRATGESQPTDGCGAEVLRRLTPQELQIVRLAASGLSNRDIGAQLFLSPRTVGYHLYKAFPKLGIASRHELAQVGPLS